MVATSVTTGREPAPLWFLALGCIALLVGLHVVVFRKALATVRLFAQVWDRPGHFILFGIGWAVAGLVMLITMLLQVSGM